MNKIELKKKYKDEMVFVCPYNSVSDIQNGFTRIYKRNKNNLTRFDRDGRFVFRYDAEGHPEIQQIIPYSVVMNPEETKFYVYKRLAGESRLTNQLSMGFGGHINPEDVTGRPIAIQGLKRELNEELNLSIKSMRFIGYIRNEDTSILNDHVGIVFITTATDISVREKNNIQGMLVEPEQLYKQFFAYESWSKSLINFLVQNKYKFD